MAASHFRSLEITRDGSKGDNSRPYLTMQDVPPETASAEEVQCFIEQLLLSQYKVDAERAHQLSQCWSIGTGRELRKYPARLFVKIFGDEAGWVLYKEIHSRLFQSQMEETGVGVLDPKTRREFLLYNLFWPIRLGSLTSSFQVRQFSQRAFRKESFSLLSL